MAKLFEGLIAAKLSALLKNAIIEEQHGFVQGRSTVTNLTLFCNFLLEAVESGSQVDCIYTDFSKAFDSVDHWILIDKLPSFGIFGALLRWIADFLTERVQRVKINESYSRAISVTSGVPQGSHLGPLLFNLFVNDIKSVFLHSEFLLYADDMKMFRIIKSEEDSRLLQRDLEGLDRWCLVNNLPLNIAKCNVMQFSRRHCMVVSDYALQGSSLGVVKQVRDLGVLLSSDLSFSAHIQQITSRAISKLGFIIRHGKHFRCVSTLRLLYCSIVRPQLEYCSVLWSPHQHVYRYQIERVQHRFVRYCCFRMNQPMGVTCHVYGPALAKLNLLSLESRRLLFDLLFLYRVINGIVRSSPLLLLIGVSVPQKRLRSRELFSVRTHRTNYGVFGPINRICMEANQFPGGDLDYFHMSLDQLKSSICDCLRRLSL